MITISDIFDQLNFIAPASGILNHLNFYCGPFSLTAIPIVLTTWLLTRKNVVWQWRDFLLLFLAPALWFFLTFYINSKKTLGNVAIEPFLLGGIVGILFILSVFISRKNAKLKFPFLIAAGLAGTLLLQFLFPMLRE